MTVRLSATRLLRPVLFAPPSMPVLDLLVKMQATRTHMALVIDEYGGTEGLVSIEDIIEVVVGDIEDEHDAAEGPRIAAVASGGFVADARADLDEVSEALGADITTITDAEEVDTIGGLVTALAGHVPVRGEIIVESGFEFEVLDADPRRVKTPAHPPHGCHRAGRRGRARGATSRQSLERDLRAVHNQTLQSPHGEERRRRVSNHAPPTTSPSGALVVRDAAAPLLTMRG